MIALIFLATAYLLLSIGTGVCTYEDNMKSWKDGDDEKLDWWAPALVAFISFTYGLLWPFWLYLWAIDRFGRKATAE